MKFVCSGVPNCREEEGNGGRSPMKGREEEERAKVYPFTVSLPRYAAWKSYVRILLNQLKSCPRCKAAADVFPISTLPKVHKLPNGKVLRFKGLTDSASCDAKPDSSRSDNGTEAESAEKESSSPLMDSHNDNEPSAHHHQLLSTFHEPDVEEYDMVTIDPNCLKHGKYSLTTWLQKKGANVIGMKSRVICQIYPKSKISQNHCTRRIKEAQKRDVSTRLITSNFSKDMVDKDVVEKPSRKKVYSILKKHKNENFEFNVLKEIETNTTTNTSILFQNKTNILLTCSHQNDLVLEPKQTINSKMQMAHLNRKTQFIPKQILLESNDNKRMSEKITSMERKKCETPFGKDLIPISDIGLGKDVSKCLKTYTSQYRRMCHLKGLNYINCFDGCNEAIEGNSKLSNGTKITLRGDDTRSASTTPTKFTREEQLMAHDIFGMKELEQVEQQFEQVEHENDKLVNETQINVVVDEPSTCTPKWITIEESQMAHDIINIDEVEQTKQLKCVQHENQSLVNETKIKLVDESSKCAPTWFSIEEHQMSSDICNLKELGQDRQQLECNQYENDNLVDETSTCTLTKFTIEEQQMTSYIFDIKELEKTQQRLEKIVDTAKSLQLGLNNHLYCDSPIEKVSLSKVQILEKSEAQKWLSNIAIERATNKISEIIQGGRVRQLVQVFESIK